jgi:hypothetical protein
LQVQLEDEQPPPKRQRSSNSEQQQQQGQEQQGQEQQGNTSSLPAEQQQQQVQEQQQQQQQQGDASSPLAKQQQQQQQGNTSSPSLTLADLKRLLQQQLSATSFSNYSISLNLWSRSCGSTDVRTMLHNPQALAQHITGVDASGEPAYSAGTASVYLYSATGLLRFAEVQQMMSAQAVAELKQCVKEAVAVVNARAAGKAAAAAARQQQQLPQLPPPLLQQEQHSPAVHTNAQQAAAGAGVAAAGGDGVPTAAGSLATPCARCGSAVAAAAAGAGCAASGLLAAGSGLAGSKRTAEQQVRKGRRFDVAMCSRAFVRTVLSCAAVAACQYGRVSHTSCASPNSLTQ